MIPDISFNPWHYDGLIDKGLQFQTPRICWSQFGMVVQDCVFKISDYRIRFCITSLPHLLEEFLITKFNYFPDGALLHSPLIILNILPSCKFFNPQSPLTSVGFLWTVFQQIWFYNYLFTIFHHNLDQFISYEIIKYFQVWNKSLCNWW